MNNTFIYQGITYNSWKELKEATGFSTCKVKAKIKDQEIIQIKHTGEITYGSEESFKI